MGGFALLRVGLEGQIVWDALCRKLLCVLVVCSGEMDLVERGTGVLRNTYLCRLRAAGRVMSSYGFGFMERHGTAYPTIPLQPRRVCDREPTSSIVAEAASRAGKAAVPSDELWRCTRMVRNRPRGFQLIHVTKSLVNLVMHQGKTSDSVANN